MSTTFHWAYEGATVTLPTGEVVDLALDSTDPRVHIGKRSAAVWYCYSCNLTLCRGGESGIHHGKGFHDACPSCGGTPNRSAQPEDVRPTGVAGACSFSWAQEPDAVRRTCEERADEEIVVDEYGRQYTGRAFLAMLDAQCPVHLLHVGEWFS